MKKDIERSCKNFDCLYNRIHEIRRRLGYEDVRYMHLSNEAAVIIQDVLKIWEDGFEGRLSYLNSFFYHGSLAAYHKLGEQHKKEGKMSKQCYVSNIRDVLANMFVLVNMLSTTFLEIVQSEKVLKELGT